MKRSWWILGSVLVLFLGWLWTGPRPRSASGHRTLSPETAPSGRLHAFDLLSADAARRFSTPAVTTSTPTPQPVSPPRPLETPMTAHAQFAFWVQSYLADRVARPGWLEDGLRLAIARREALATEIKTNPRLALEHAAPWRWRQELPREITAQLEEMISGRGTLSVYCAMPLPGADYREFGGRTIRYVTLAASTHAYRAYVYGRRVSQMTLKNVALHGIALDNNLALDEDPVRVLEEDEASAMEVSAKAPAAPPCAWCGTPAVVGGQQRLLDFGGQILRVCSLGHADELSRTLKAVEGPAAPRPLLDSSAWAGTNPPPADPRGSFGTKQVLYMRVVFPDDPEVPISESGAADVMDRVNDFYVEASYQKTALITTVTPVLTVAQPKDWYGFDGPGSLLADASDAALLAGFDTANYDLVLLQFTPVPGFDWGGLGGGGVAWLQGSGVGLIAHELGHNYGLAHANFWDTRRPKIPANPNNNPFDPDSLVGHDSVIGVGDEVEYGDVFDVMGSGGGEGPANTNQSIASFTGHFNAIGKQLLGWLPDAQIVDINLAGSGTNRIYVNDVPRLVEGRDYALKVAKDAQREYWVSARGKINSPWLLNGVELHWGAWQQASGYSDLLDTTPGSKPGRQDAAIQVGCTFADEESNVYITPVAKGGTGIDAWFDVVTQVGPFPANLPPVVDLAVSANVIPPGGLVTLTASATDPNGDTMAYHWESSAGSLLPNAPSVTLTFPNEGEYVVRCEVSDMKGGITSKHVVITVGSPVTFRISGVVIDNLGSPLRGVRLSNGSLTPSPDYEFADDYQWTFTDSDGAFTLGNISNGVYSIGAFLPGYVTKPLNFDRVVTISDESALDVQFIATPLQRVSVVKQSDADAVRGRPGAFTLSRAGDPNTALDVSVLFAGSAVSPGDYLAYTNSSQETNVVETPFGPRTNVYLFGIVHFDTNVLKTNLAITPVTNAAASEDKDVALTIMHPLEVAQFSFTNDSSGILSTNTNYVAYSEWDLRTVQGVDTWFQNSADYVPFAPGEARMVLRGKSLTQPVISILATTPTTTKNLGDAGQFTLVRSGPLDVPVTVQLGVGGTAVPDSDYESLPATVSLLAGQRFVRLPVFVRPNRYLSGNLTIQLLVNSDPTYRIGLGAATVTIVDNNLPLVTVAATGTEAWEATGDSGTLVFSRTGDLLTDLVVNYLVTGTAVSGQDYRTLPGSVTLPAGQPSASVAVVPRDNRTKEGDLQVVVLLSDSPMYNVGFPSTAAVTIRDKALPIVSVVASIPAAVESGTPGEFTLTRAGDLSQDLFVNVKLGGSAVMLSDYAAIPSRIRIPATARSVTIPVVPVQNGFREDDERVVLQILPGAAYNVAADFEAIVTITDSDSGALPAVGFSLLSSRGPVTAGEALIAVAVSANPAENNDVTVAYTVTGGTGIPGVDYDAGSSTGQLVFPHNPNTTGKGAFTNRVQLLSIPLLENINAVGDRTIVLTLIPPPPAISNWLATNDITITNASGDVITTNEVVTNQTLVVTPMNALFDVYNTHTFTILEEDGSTITVEATGSIAREQGAQPGVFTIKRAGPTNHAVTVYLQMSGLACNGNDYQTLPSSVVIPAGASSVEVPLLPVDDPTQEYLETATLTLLYAPGAKLGDPFNATISIIDNDGTVEFTRTAYSAPETAGSVPISVRRTGDTNSLVVVNYSITPGTATPGVNFVATNGTLTFLPGVDLVSMPVTLLDDGVVGSNVTVNLTLRNGFGGAPLGGQETAVLTILEADTAVEFTSASYTVYEDETNALITLQRLGTLTNQFSVDCLATNGTALDGVDFRATNVTVTFVPGQTNATVRVRVLDNLTYGGGTNPTVQLSLTNVTAGAFLGRSTNATLTILDDESVLQLAAPQYRVDEYARVVSVYVQRLGGTIHPVRVDFATSDGTAHSGINYLAEQGTLTFAGDTNVLSPSGSGQVILLPGETNKAINIRILDDLKGTGDQTFNIAIWNPRGGDAYTPTGSVSLGPQTNSVVTIVDAQKPGAVDFGFDPGNGTDGPVLAVAVQADDSVLLGGTFSQFDGVVMNNIARLHEDGYLDSFFNPGAGANAAVQALAVQPDGRILAGGAFTQINSQNAGRLARLNADGTIDPDFNPGRGADGIVRALAVSPDGTIVLGGDFASINGVARSGIARLQMNGSPDTSFDPGSGASGSVLSVAVDPEGRVVLGGRFTTVDGVNLPNLARLNSDGSADTSFHPGTGPDGAVQSIALAPDGSIVIGGAFANFGNIPRGGVARLRPDGSLDTTFDPGAGAGSGVLTVGVQADGKVVVGGAFTNFADLPLNRIARLNPDGSVDLGFEIGSGANAAVRTLVSQRNTAVVVGGDFTVVNRLPRHHIARIHGDELVQLNRLQFSAATYRVPETAGQAGITVVRSGDLTTPVQVGYATMGGTATAGVDYQPASGVLQFLPGQSQQTFNVTVLDDHAARGNQTVDLILTNLPPGFTFNAQLSATLTIEDKESVVAFSASDYVALTTDGQAIITVIRTGPATNGVTADYSTEDGTARSGVDYTAVEGTLRFDAGIAEQQFIVPILTNDASGSSRTVWLRLTNATGGSVLGSQSNAVLTIGSRPVTFYSLNLTPPVGGTVTPGSGPYPVGSTQILKAVAERDYGFAGWQGTTNTSANPLAVVMNRNYNLTARFVPLEVTYDFEPPFQAADLTSPPWRNPDMAPWLLTEETAGSGRFAVRSGLIGDGEASALQLIVETRAGAMSFDVHVSSEAGWDFLEFYVNGTKVQRWSGEVPWESVQFSLPAGVNSLTWRYVKDANFSAGADAAFMDSLFVPLNTPDPTPSVPRLAITPWAEGGMMIQLSGKSGVSYVLQGSADLSHWLSIATNVLQGTSVFLQDPQAPSLPYRFYRAFTP